MLEFGFFASFVGLMTIGEFKLAISQSFPKAVPLLTSEEQHLYANQLTVEEVKEREELQDEMTLAELFGSRSKQSLTLVIKPSHLSHAFLKHRLPHIDSIHRQQLLTQLESIPIEQIDVDSIRETSIATLPSSRLGITIRNTDEILLDELLIDGQLFLPLQVDANVKQVKFQAKYSYQFSAASEEYVKAMNETYERYVSDVIHCTKLLHDLPIALTNSQHKLIEDGIRVVEEPSCEIELFDLGAMVVEQTRIRKEIKDQEERLAQLKPPVFDRSKFTSNEFQFEINLKFGWHQFGPTAYQLIYTPVPMIVEKNEFPPIPIESEINYILQPNQHRVSVKRTRQQFEATTTCASSTANEFLGHSI